MPFTMRDVKTDLAQTTSQKRQWVRVANSVLARCQADGGSLEDCEGPAIRQANGVIKKRVRGRNERIAMDNTLFFVNAELDGHAREEILHGSLHLVRPIKIVRSMVLNGLGDGPRGQFLPPEELARCPVTAWNSIPLTLGHPFTINNEQKQYCSANSAPMLQKFQVGMILNACRDDEGRIAGEAWLHVDNCELLGGKAAELVTMFRANATAEVSSAYTFRLDPTTGQYNGMAYNAIQRDIYPDHVAILVDSTGACSNADGCGLGVNGCECGGTCVACRQSGTSFNDADEAGIAKRVVHYLMELFTGNATFGDIHMAVHGALRARFGEMTWPEEIEDNPRRVIFSQNGQRLALPFTVDQQGRVVLSETDPTSVQQSTQFISNQKETSVEEIKTLEALYAASEIDEGIKTQIRDSLAFHQAETTKQAEARESRVVALAANEAVPFDLETLKTMSDTMLDGVEAMAEKTKKPVATNRQGKGGIPESALTANADDGVDYTWVGGSTIPGQN